MKTANVLRIAVLLVPVLCTAAASDYTWQRPHAEVLSTGDLRWAPEPFDYAPVGEVRYIDYEGGDDAGPGTREQPWKHHPWDAKAVGRAAEGTADTYVFKQGVTYRGALEVPKGASGHLTRDPTWGEGEARFYGSEALTGGWRRGADHPGIREPGKVWHIDLEFAPRNLWMVDGGKVARIALAREPDWTEPDPQDPMSQWYTWEQPEWWNRNHKAEVDGETYHLGIDTTVLTGTAKDYVGGTVWTEWGIVMGSPYPARIRAYDPQKKAIAFGGPWVWGASEKIITNNRYYLEDMPWMLDSPGEFWVDKRGDGGRLYLRLPEDRDPNTVDLEAGRYINLIDAEELGDLEISGLTFRFTNTHWEYDIPRWAHPDLRAGVLRLRGNGGDVRVSNNTFGHAHMPLRIEVPLEGRLDSITFCDNDVRYTDHGAVTVTAAKAKGSVQGYGQIGGAHILRNRLEHIGWRVVAGAHGHSIQLNAYHAHIAGNILKRTAGLGINVSGFHVARGREGADIPWCRYLIHHNLVEDCLLKSCDWGAFYITTHGGPSYIYDNVAVNPVGQMNWAGKRLGYAYYMDGAYKGYLFNNIAVGYPVEKGHKRRSAAAFQSMISFQNTYFNNTAYRFKTASRRQAPQGSREKYLGNVFMDIGEWVFRHAKPAGSPAAANAAHLPEEDAEFLYETNAYSRNVFYDVGEKFGVFESNGMPHEDLESFAAALAEHHALSSDVGVVARQCPVRNPDAGDFRPSAGSEAVDAGVKVFVPWALSGVVGEWYFTLNREDPAVVLDEHWYQTDYYVDRSMYRQTPRYPLRAANVDADDYMRGPLEDWTDGALTFDGEGQYASIAHQTLVSPFAYMHAPSGGAEVTVPGSAKKTVNVGEENFLIELYFRAPRGGSALVSKSDGTTGYQLRLEDEGRPILILQAGREVEQHSGKTPLADGEWHHLIVECDREDGRVSFYVDGRETARSNSHVAQSASLANDGDFYVGRGPDDGYFAGVIDFLRVAHGTLADAQTTIDELYEWQFNGPFLHDFAGRAPVGQRDVGAIELGR